MRLTQVYAPDGMASSSRHEDRFDDGLVHNHHWAVTTDEAYPCHGRGAAAETEHGYAFAGVVVSPMQSFGQTTHDHDRHDDGLVHNHDWAVSGK